MWYKIIKSANWDVGESVLPNRFGTECLSHVKIEAFEASKQELTLLERKNHKKVRINPHRFFYFFFLQY